MKSDINTVLYSSEVSPLADDTLFKRAYSAVSEIRRKKADRLRLPSDRYLSIGAELLLMYGLQKAGVCERPLKISYTDEGKPYISSENVFFSLSHSGDFVLCAVSDTEIGCDAEKEENADLEIAKRFFHPAEYADILRQKNPREQNSLFYRYWTLKESFMKAIGLGMKLPLDSFCIIQNPDNIFVKQTVDTHNYYFTEFSDIPGYKCSVCTREHKKTIQRVSLNIGEIMEELQV